MIKLPKFSIYRYTPLEVVYDSETLEPLGYTPMLYRDGFPYTYGKFSLNFELKEVYPWKVKGLSAQESVDLVLNGLDYPGKLEPDRGCYYSVDAKTSEITDYYTYQHEFGILQKFDYKTGNLVHTYRQLDELAGFCKDEHIIDFILREKPEYGFFYCSNPINFSFKKMLLGWTPLCENNEKYQLLQEVKKGCSKSLQRLNESDDSIPQLGQA
jgi:hypothetical protein